MKEFFKTNKFKILISILLGVLAILFASFILPLQRHGYKTIYILFIILYSICFIVSIIFCILISLKLRLCKTMEQKTKEKFALIFYFGSLIILSVLLTIIFGIINAVNPGSIFLTQGILSICLVLGYYLGLSIPLLININFLK